MADHSKPLTTSAYADFVTELDARFDDLAVGLDPARTTATNVPTYTIRWNSASNKWQIWSGTAWGDLSATFAFPAITCTTLGATGNVTLGGATTNTVAVAGYMGVGGAAYTGYGLYVRNDALTTTGQAAIVAAPTGTSAATGSVIGVIANPSTAAASFTCATMTSFMAQDGTKGAGSTINSKIGLHVLDQTVGTSNYGIYNDVSSGANKWGYYGAGTAKNFYKGDIVSGSGSFYRDIDTSSNSFAGGTDYNVGARVVVFGSTHATSPNTTIFYRGTTESARIDGAGNVGIGGVTPSAWNTFAVLQNTGGAIASTTTQNGLWHNLYYNSGFKYKATAAASLYQQTGSVHNWFSVASGTADAAATTTQVLSVDKDKSLALQGATSKTGTGISFPATQSASTDANTLDDYEEGTFTPTIVGTSTAGTGTYSSQSGRYTKIGRTVFFYVKLAWSAHTGTGNMQVSGLPFTAGGYNEPCTFMHGGLSLTAGNVIQGYVTGTTVDLTQVPTGGGSNVAIPIDTAVTYLYVSGQYDI